MAAQPKATPLSEEPGAREIFDREVEPRLAHLASQVLETQEQTSSLKLLTETKNKI
jgi:hypothetical protein